MRATLLRGHLPGATPPPAWDALPDSLQERMRPRLWAELDAYVRDRKPPGVFVRAILESDVSALSRCQPLSLLSLGAVVDALAYAPRDCYGSVEIVEAWLAGVCSPAEREARGETAS